MSSIVVVLVAGCSGGGTPADGGGGAQLPRAQWCEAIAAARCAVLVGCCPRYETVDCASELEMLCERAAEHYEAIGLRYDPGAASACVERWPGFAAPTGCTTADPASAAYQAFVDACVGVWTGASAAPGEACGEAAGAACAPQDGGAVGCWTRMEGDASVSTCEVQPWIPEGASCTAGGVCAPGTHCDEVDLVCAVDKPFGAGCDATRSRDCGYLLDCADGTCSGYPLEAVCEEPDELRP